MRHHLRIAIIFVSCFAITRAAAQAPAPSPHQAAIDRIEKLTMLPPGEWRFHENDMPDGQSAAVDDSAWPLVKEGYKWTTGTAWFRRRIEVPRSLDGYDLTGSRLWLDLNFGGEDFVPLIVYINGTRVAMGEDLEPLVLMERATPGAQMLVAIKALAPPVPNTFRHARVTVETPSSRPSTRIAAQELTSAEALAEKLPGDKAASRQVVDAAVKAIDFDALTAGNQPAFDASLRAAHDKLAALKPLFRDYSIRAVGNSHIDMAWLWPWSETVEVVRNTFRTSLQLMNEYPEYTFTQSSAQANAWLEEKYPQTFEDIKKRIAEGRWEIVGGMWVEPDLNMPDGESITRQLLVGKRYFKEKFNKDVRIGWNPDSFGYNWQLPQIYKRSGVDFFVTQKIQWSDTSKFPHKLFWWRSPDGSRVLTFFPHDYVNEIDPVRMANDLGDYAGSIKGFHELMHLYGVGDHGGGPTRAMLDEARRWTTTDPQRAYPKLFLATAQGFFDDAAKNAAQMDLPVWNSELYLEYHRGVYTTQAATKRNNRQSETLLLNAEKLSSFAWMYGREYPGKRIEYAWKKVLFNQFHDVAAGSGIAAIYRDADRDYAEVRGIAHEISRGALAELAARVNTLGLGAPIMVVNPLGWKRTDVVEAEVQLPSPAADLQITDAAGKPALSQVIERLPANRFRVLILAVNVPSLGYKVYRALGASGRGATVRASDLKATDDTLENDFLGLRLDRNTGCIRSLFDKKSNHDVLAPGACGNLLQAFHDKPKAWDAWNIDADYETQKWDIDHADSVKLIERGPLRAIFRVTKHFQASTFIQDVTLYAGIPRVEVAMDADWHEKHILLKAAFPLRMTQPTIATYEIPYGSIERPTTRNTPEERGKFEVPALRWGDLSNQEFGLSLLNDSKYGYDARDNVIRLSLLRSPEWPDPHADEGKHHFTYALYPHGGSWKTSGTMRSGYELNYKLHALQVLSHGGTLPAEHSFAELSGDNLVLTAVKKSEDEDVLLFRFFEYQGKQSDAQLRVPGARQAYETNLMEQREGNLPLRSGTITIPTAPYQIKTVAVEVAHSETPAPNSPAPRSPAPSKKRATGGAR